MLDVAKNCMVLDIQSIFGFIKMLLTIKKKLVTSQVYDVKTSFKGNISIPIVFNHSHLVNHIYNIPEFAGTKLRLKFGDVS